MLQAKVDEGIAHCCRETLTEDRALAGNFI
ncbi:MAG: hypothetical protein CM15mP125_0590 [Gammaproteobacteria bacterium]|nr:MAG: hypothetical protein CM15mP125_0590 [Gammaproteobacteria bacterium]